MKKSFKLLSTALAALTVTSVSPTAFAAPRYKKSSNFENTVAYGLFGSVVTAVSIFAGIKIYDILSEEDDDTPNEVIIINSENDFKKIQDHKNEIVKVIVNVENIPQNAFENCSKLIEADLPKVKTIGICSFAGCKKLKKVNAPKLTTICAGAFINCKELEDFELENVSRIGINAFGGCKKLSFMDLINAQNN